MLQLRVKISFDELVKRFDAVFVCRTQFSIYFFALHNVKFKLRKSDNLTNFYLLFFSLPVLPEPAARLGANDIKLFTAVSL